MKKYADARSYLPALVSALLADDCLGFDRWTDARDALLAHPDYRERWECSPRLVQAFEDYRQARAAGLTT